MRAIMPVRLDSPDYRQCCLFHKSLIRLCQGITESREDFLDLAIVFSRDISSAIGSSCHSGALNVCREEWKVVEESSKTAFAYDCSGVFC